MADKAPEHSNPEPEDSGEYSPPWSFSAFTEESDPQETAQAEPATNDGQKLEELKNQPSIDPEAETLMPKKASRPDTKSAPEPDRNNNGIEPEQETQTVTENGDQPKNEERQSTASGQKRKPDSVMAGKVAESDLAGSGLIEVPLKEKRDEKYTRNSNPVVIEFANVTKVFRNQVVLRDLSFQIHQGETLCLIGESGCGKTVNLKLMIGLMKPDKGRVSFKGQDLARMNEKQITATRIKFGFLFQMAALFDSMTIYDNVAFGLREHRLMPEKEMPEYIRERLAEVGLPEGVETKKPAELSGGQRKRVGLARALALKPEVMLYDEPTTGLDPIMTDIINELILQTQDHGAKTGIIVTHEMRTVTKCADRVIMLYPISRLAPGESQILYDGPPEGMEDHPDPRVRQFVRGEAGDRIKEMTENRLADETDSGLATMDPDDIVAARPPGKTR